MSELGDESDVISQSSASGNSSGMYNEEGGSWELVTVESQYKLSCWDELDPFWLLEAEQNEDDQIYYVHGEILEWIVEQINQNLLNEILRATVEEVHHHNLDGPVYLIKFYKQAAKYRFQMVPDELNDLTNIKYEMEYKMPWKSNPTYFLRIDSEFEDRKIRIMNKLEELNLLDCFNTTSMDVNWLYIPKIEIYEFFVDLPNERIHKIDSIFREISVCRPSIYICDQFEWHREVFWQRAEQQVDKIAMDICVEEWSRYDLLKDFPVEDILHLDLANKDYRDPYFNEYLDRYLNRLLKKSLPQLYSDHNENLELPLHQLDSYIGKYFVSRFHDKISILCYDKLAYATARNRYDLPIIEKSSKTVELNGDQPPPDTLLNIQCHRIEYNISNYIHFSNSLLRALLNKPNERQTYNIRIDKEFNFMYDNDERIALRRNVHCWPFDKKQIIINFRDCIESGTNNLIYFANYLIDLFNRCSKFGFEEVSMCFTNCIIEDFSFLENLTNDIDDIKFVGMNISSQQISVLSRTLTKQNSVTFLDCQEITDHNVMTLLENINFDRLHIEGTTGCTSTIHFLLSEHLMNTRDIDNIHVSQYEFMFGIANYFPHQFDRIEFFKDDQQIVARDRNSKKTVDLYCLLNGIEEDELIDPFNNMYME